MLHSSLDEFVFARLSRKMPIAGEEGVVVVVVRPIAGEQWAYMGESGSSGCCAECRAALLEHVGDTEGG